ncbi:MAG: hypothetical protein IJ246_02430 [Clostridia bacterium]|nr:hypothetical protein [Clostridia bacterium]
MHETLRLFYPCRSEDASLRHRVCHSPATATSCFLRANDSYRLPVSREAEIRLHYHSGKAQFFCPDPDSVHPGSDLLSVPCFPLQKDTEISCQTIPLNRMLPLVCQDNRMYAFPHSAAAQKRRDAIWQPQAWAAQSIGA